LLTGLALFFSYATQTLGLVTVAAGKAAFITGLYIVIVPIASRAIAREAPDRATVVGVILAAVGLGLMSLNLPFQVARGDFLTFLCAVGFSAHILLVSRYSGRGDTVLYTGVQLLVVALGSSVAALAIERPLVIPSGAWPAILFTSIVTTAFAFLVQSTVQQYTSATHTALIFAAEPVFGALFAWLLAGEVLLPREMAGAGLILAGMLVAEARNLRGSRSTVGCGP
jgi:drug/metabolite transporter (DMT)-like permease